MTRLHFATPQDAEDAFYLAFSRADAAGMMQVWLDAQHIECIHPAGPRLIGPEAIHQAWQQIFAQGERLQFQVQREHCTQTANLAIHSVNEHITRTDQPGSTALVLATNIYELTADGWRMVLHHASPAQAMAHEARSSIH